MLVINFAISVEFLHIKNNKFVSVIKYALIMFRQMIGVFLNKFLQDFK